MAPVTTIADTADTNETQKFQTEVGLSTLVNGISSSDDPAFQTRTYLTKVYLQVLQEGEVQKEDNTPKKGFNTTTLALMDTLAKRFPENKYPFHNINHSISVLSRAFVLADIISQTTNIPLSEEDYMAIVFEVLGHDRVQDSDIQAYLKKGEEVIAKINNGETPQITDVKDTIKRKGGDNEMNSYTELENILAKTQIIAENGPISLKDYLGQERMDAIKNGILATTPDFTREAIKLPNGTTVRGLNISQPKLKKLINDLHNNSTFIISIVLPLADLPTSLGGMETKREALSGGYKEFRELHPNIALVATVMNMGLEEHRLRQIITEETTQLVIDEIIEWTNSQASIVMWQGQNMRIAVNSIGTQFPDTSLGEILEEKVSGYEETAKYAINVKDKLQRELDNTNDPYERLRIALSYAEYPGFDTKMDGLQSKMN